MLGKFKIGLTPGTVVDLIATAEITPQRKYDQEIITSIDERYSVSNDLFVRISGKNKKRVTLNFEYKSLSQVNTVESYCNVPQFYYVVIENSTSATQYLAGYFFLRLENVPVDAQGDEFLHKFSIRFNPK